MPLDYDLMINVLTDVHFAEAALSHVNVLKKDSVATIYYEQIYQRHNIKGVDFDSSMAVMKRNPLQMWLIYQRVMLNIDEKEKDMQTE